MIWTTAAVAVVVHGLVFHTVYAFGLNAPPGFHPHPRVAKHAAETELKTTCAGNVALASGARFATCLAPWVTDFDQCVADQQMNLWIDLSGCQAQNDPGTAVSLVEPKQTEKLAEIDPEKLLDEVEQQKQQQPPPPPPPPQLAQAAAPPPPPPPQQRQQQQQVVEVVKPKEESEPVNARLLSEYNVNVEKQKVARGAASEPMVAKSKPAELAPKDKPKDEPAVKQPDPDRIIGKNPNAPDVPGHLTMRPEGAQSPSENEQEQRVRGSTSGGLGALTADGLIPRKGQGALEQQRHERSEIPRGEGGAGGGAMPNLKPSEDVLERAIGGGSVDHLEEVENGDETALSAKRWVYASFFNRLKRQVAQNWDPASVWRRSDPTGTVYGFKTRITEVRVSLTRKGDLEKIVVTAPSGVNELDDEAVRAFHAAAPFPNPPDGLIQKDNLITFAFSFYFEIGSPHTSWRILRSQ